MKKLITIRLEPETIEAIEVEAKKQERTKSNFIQLAVKKYLESLKS